MPDTEIERTIFKLELDGSAYIEGADKLANSTNKLSEAQEAANKKLIELKGQQASYSRELETVNAILKANEQETIQLTKRLNELKAAEQGTSAEAKNLQAQLRGIATNTKEFKIEAAALKTNLSNATSALNLHSKEVAKAEAATGNFTKGLTKAYSGLRQIANVIPGIGIGGLVLLIAGPLVNAIKDWYQSLEKVNEAAKKTADINESLHESASAYTKASVEVNTLRINVDLAKQGFIDKKQVVDEYNESMGKVAGQVKTLDEVEQKLVEHGDAYIQMMLLKAAANYALEKAAKSAFDAEEKRRKEAEDFLTTTDKLNKTVLASPGFSRGGLSSTTLQQSTAEADRVAKEQAEKRKQAAIKISEDEKHTFEDIAKKFEQDAAKIATEHHFNFFGSPPPDEKKIVNIYEQELQKLKADIAKLDEKGFTDEATITKAVEEDFKKRSDAFVKAFNNKQLTAPQLASLQGYLKNLSDLTLNQQLKSFRETRQKYLQAINDEIVSLQAEESTKRIQSLQNSFEKERQTIINETEKTVSALEQKRDQRIAQILKDAAKNGLKPEDIAPQIAQIKSEYEKLLNDLQIIKNQKLQQLSFDTFEQLSEDAKRGLDAENLGISQGSLFLIQKQAKLFKDGKISFSDYQKSLTDIAKNEAAERFKVEKAYLELEIKIRQDKLATDKTLTDDQTKKLRDEIRSLQKQLVEAEKGSVLGDTNDPNKNDHPKLEKLQQYVEAISTLTQSVISFWQLTNEAEQKALDYSISIQEKRVDAAQRIADRGNAQYLKQEQDRLNDLNVQRENAARKQLAINAALQGSEILVSLISGIAQGVKIGGPAGAIIEVAAIVAAIAGAFAIAQSFKQPSPSFFVGTKDTGNGGKQDGKGGFSATLHPNEAVIPADRNKKYHPAIEAIYDETIPAERLNSFVQTYHKIKSVPQPNYERIREAAVMHIERDGKMSVLLSENNKKLDEHILLQRLTLSAMKKLGVNVSLDKHGLAISQMEVIEEIKRSKYK